MHPPPTSCYRSGTCPSATEASTVLVPQTVMPATLAPESQEITSAPGNECDLKYNQRSQVRETKSLCYITTYWITKERPPVTTLLNPCGCLLLFQLYPTLCSSMDCRQPGKSRGFSRQEYRSGLPCTPPADLPKSRIKPLSHVFCIDKQVFLPLAPPVEPLESSKKRKKRQGFA